MPFTALSADVWSGTHLTLRSAGFAGLDPTAVLLGADTVAFARVDDTTLTVTLPDQPGMHQLRVVSPLVVATGIPVHLNGFLDVQDGPLFSGRTVRAAEPTELFGSGPTGLRRWNVSTGQTWDYPDSLHFVSCARGVGRGPQAGQLVLLTGACDSTWSVWRIEPTIERVDTTPWRVGWFLDVVGPGRYVAPWATHYVMVGLCDTACAIEVNRGNTQDIVRSPTGDRAVPIGYTVSDSGVLVVDAGAGRVSYVVPPFGSAGGAAFSAGGDTLYLAGQDGPATVGGGARLVALRAADGMQFAAESLSYAPCAVALDPVRPWLYVAGIYNEQPDYWSVLGVFDRTSLAPIVTLRVLDGAIYTGGNTCQVLPSPPQRRVYVVETWNGPHEATERARVTRFETPP